jgi:Uma2 family endonuclease
MTLTAPLQAHSLELILRSPDASWDYARWSELPEDGKRYEVIDGVLYMTTAPSFFHQWIVRQITLQLVEQIERGGHGIVAFAPIGLLMPGCDPVQPDVVVVGAADIAQIRDRRIHAVPALLIEVVSPSTRQQDTEIKRAAYARAAVPEYWIVRPAERDVLVHSSPDVASGLYLATATYASGADLIAATLPFRAPVASFFAGSPDETV